jgi:hypothetical protein
MTKCPNVPTRKPICAQIVCLVSRMEGVYQCVDSDIVYIRSTSAL